MTTKKQTSVTELSLSFLIAYVRNTGQRNDGGYNGVDQPLPIPNREVKRACADGTALTGVGE